MRQVNVNTIPLQTAASVNGPAIDAENLFQVSVQMVATGAAAGTMKLQASNDINENFVTQFVPSNWSDIPSASVVVSGAGAFLIPVTTTCYQWIRVVYANSGSGTISVNIKFQGA